MRLPRLVPSLALSVAAVGATEAAPAQPAAPPPFGAAAASPADDRAPIHLVVSGAEYVVARDRVLRGVVGTAAPTVRLPGRGGGLVERVWGERHGGDLLLAYELTDGESAWTEVVRLDPRTLARRWWVHLPNFNLGPAFVSADTAYLTVLGTVAKVDLRTGRTLWRRDGLYSRGPHFDCFAQPRLRGDTLVVPAERTAPGAPADTVRLLAGSGRVAGVYLAPARRDGGGTPGGGPVQH
jgi:hypothetical protein